MSSSSMSESCPSGATTQYQINLPDFERKIKSVINETEQLEVEIRNMQNLQDKIDEFRGNNVHRTEQAKEKMTEISNRISIAGKEMVSACDETYKKLAAKANPYINSGVAPKEEGALSVLERCIQLRGSIRGLEKTMEKTMTIEPIVISQHKQLFTLEAKQRGAMTRRKKLSDIKRLAIECPAGTPLHPLAILPAFLMCLDRNEKVSEYYQKKFKGMEDEIFAFFESLIHNEPSKMDGIGSVLTTQSSLSNGEIHLETMRDFEEIPIDTAQSSASFMTN